MGPIIDFLIAIIIVCVFMGITLLTYDQGYREGVKDTKSTKFWEDPDNVSEATDERRGER